MTCLRALRLSTAALASLAAGPALAGAARPTPCTSEIGAAAAGRLRAACLNVSPATHPPCGIRNGCALIADEIARGCAILGDAEAAKIAACGPAPTSAVAAVDVVRRFYGAIGERDGSTAYAMMTPAAHAARSLAAFEAEHAATRSTRVETGPPGAIEGAAGSAFVTVPVTVDEVLENGSRQRSTGRYVLRRVEPQGPYPSDAMRWHIEASDLSPAPR